MDSYSPNKLKEVLSVRGDHQFVQVVQEMVNTRVHIGHSMCGHFILGRFTTTVFFVILVYLEPKKLPTFILLYLVSI